MLFKKEDSKWVKNGDDDKAKREHIESKWIFEHRPIPYANLLSVNCFQSVGVCRGCVNFKCAINGGTK